MPDADHANPYQSPAAEPVAEVERQPEAERSLLRGLRWAGVFGLNLPVAMFFGLAGTRGGERLGIAAGVLLLLAVGGTIAYARRLVGKMMIRGGLIVALTQLYPLLPIMAGSCAVIVLGLLGFDDPGFGPTGGLGIGGAMLATLVTGGLLAVAGGVVGLFFWLITPASWWGGVSPVAPP